jgi:hypothetical protein
LTLKLLLQSSKGINRQVVLKFRQNQFKQEVKHYGPKSKNTLIIYGIRKNCLIGGRRLLFYQFTRRAIKLTINYRARGISLLPTSYKISSNILLSRSSPHVGEITGDHQCGFRRNESTTDQIFHNRQIKEKKMGVQ